MSKMSGMLLLFLLSLACVSVLPSCNTFFLTENAEEKLCKILDEEDVRTSMDCHEVECVSLTMCE